MKSFRRQYPSNYASVPKARRDVATFAKACGLHASDVHDITLAAGEACNNAAEHGHVVRGNFSVACSFDAGEMVVEISDGGAGFDPTGKGECHDPERLGMRGLGIFIMRSLVDDICFAVKQSGGTCVRLTKSGLRLRPASQVFENGLASGLKLAAVHHRLKALLELARAQARGRRER